MSDSREKIVERFKNEKTRIPPVIRSIVRMYLEDHSLYDATTFSRFLDEYAKLLAVCFDEKGGGWNHPMFGRFVRRVKVAMESSFPDMLSPEQFSSDEDLFQDLHMSTLLAYVSAVPHFNMRSDGACPLKTNYFQISFQQEVSECGALAFVMHAMWDCVAASYFDEPIWGTTERKTPALRRHMYWFRRLFMATIANSLMEPSNATEIFDWDYMIFQGYNHARQLAARAFGKDWTQTCHENSAIWNPDRH